MQQYPRVSVVILNWNGKQHLENFLPSVISSTYPNLEIIVADNASTDDSISFLKANYPELRLILLEENFGFAEGYNRALAQVDSEYYVLLNSDVEVVPEWIQPVISLLEADLGVAAAQPKIKSWRKKTQFEYAGAAGGFIDKYGYPFCRGRIFDCVEDDRGQYNQTDEIFWASGAALFIRSSCWKEVNGFDGDFFAHMEEIDLCWRLKNHGYKIMFCPDAEVFHLGGGTLQAEKPFKTYLNFRNNLAMLLKNLETQKLWAVLFVRLWLDFISLLKFLSEGKFTHARAVNKAHISFFRELNKNFKKRSIKPHSFNKAGFYPKSIVWDYFVKKRKHFSQILRSTPFGEV